MQCASQAELRGDALWGCGDRTQPEACTRCGCASEFDDSEERSCRCNAVKQSGCASVRHSIHVLFGLGGRAYDVEAHRDATLADLRRGLEEATGVPSRLQRFVHGSPPAELAAGPSTSMRGLPATLTMLQADDAPSPCSSSDESVGEEGSPYGERSKALEYELAKRLQERYVNFIEARAHGRAAWEDFPRYMNDCR